MAKRGENIPQQPRPVAELYCEKWVVAGERFLPNHSSPQIERGSLFEVVICGKKVLDSRKESTKPKRLTNNMHLVILKIPWALT